MRRNFTIRKSSMVEYYDTVYDHIPDRPELRKIIDHTRKLVTINRCADPYYAQPVEVFNSDANPLL